ncbi:MAG: hypothetical protein MRERC_5c012 [Mycoplasmataceae bacterium RC_NB112A]|nr:MAG: hypothetical protein MRERC_5c012 [Mycoplasmataceae bacterium RC_NB112A]
MCESKKKTILIWVLIGSIVIGAVSLGIVFANFKSVQAKKPKNPLPPKPNPEIPPPPEESKDCPYLDENRLTALVRYESGRMSMREKDLVKWKQIPHNYIVNLWKKGYHWHDIIQLWEWKLEAKEIPDLKAERRIGVTNELFVTFNMEGESDWIGGVRNFVIIGRKVSSGGKINLDPKIIQDLPLSNPDDGAKRGKYTKKIVQTAFQVLNINPTHWEIFLLNCIGAEYFEKENKVAYGRSGGKSASSMVYLATLSVLQNKPISKQVTGTGALKLSNKNKKGKVNNQEIILSKGANLPIRGVKEKIQAALKKGINRFVFSKYQSPPKLLSKWQHRKWTGTYTAGDNKKIYTEEKWIVVENYQEVVPTETKNKIKEIHWAENINQLRELVLEGKLS